MDVFEAIRTRRSVGKVKGEPVPRELVEKILEAATWAPNHFHTEPWRFFVLTGEGRRALGETLKDIASESMKEPLGEDDRLHLQKAEEKAFRAPVIIAVACVVSQKPQVFPQEEKAAVYAAIQNMLLAAHALGLGAIWRTGAPAYHPKMKALFHLGPEDEVAGFIYLGYPDREMPPGKRTPFEEKTQWWDR